MTYLMLFSDGDLVNLTPDVLVLPVESQMPSSVAAFLSHTPGTLSSALKSQRLVVAGDKSRGFLSHAPAAPASALKSQRLVVAGDKLRSFLSHAPAAPPSTVKSQKLIVADYKLCPLLSSC